MSTSSKKLLAGALALSFCAASSAGIEDGKKRTKPTKVESMARVVDRGTDSSLRCYQQGKMVFESAGVEPSKSETIAAVFKAGSGRSIQLFDLKDGFCILEHTGG
ncbi:MAG: hypothetical protein R3E83_02745 [Burkholderiaceae bacterium]